LTVTIDTVRELALALPEVEESTSYGTPSFKVRRKMVARLREEGDVLVVRIDHADKEFLIRSRPDTYFTTPHYDGYAAVLVRLGAIGRDELRELLAAAWRFVAPRRLVAAFGAAQGPDGRRRLGARRGPA
jgi:hypothetical protein